MQVLVKNPHGPQIKLADVVPSFWDTDCVYPDDHFSFAALMDQTDLVGLSPYFFLDARIAFMLSELTRATVYARGLGSLGAVAAFSKAGSGDHSENVNKTQTFIQEYLPLDPILKINSFDQIICFGEEEIDMDLWKRLNTGGTYLLGSLTGPMKLKTFDFEAVGKMWPMGGPTEFGWEFDDDSIGPGHFYFTKLKKLSSKELK